MVYFIRTRRELDGWMRFLASQGWSMDSTTSSRQAGVHCMRTWSWQGASIDHVTTDTQTAIGRSSSTTSSHFSLFFFLATATRLSCLASKEPKWHLLTALRLVVLDGSMTMIDRSAVENRWTCVYSNTNS